MYFHHIYIFKHALQHRQYPTLINIYHPFQSILGNEILNFLSHSGSDSKKIRLQSRKLGFSPWVRKIHWRREQLPTSGFLPGEFDGQRSLAGYSPQGHKELDTTERITFLLYHLASYIEDDYFMQIGKYITPSALKVEK